jgi:hypothetical protein
MTVCTYSSVVMVAVRIMTRWWSLVLVLRGGCRAAA